MTIAYVVGTFPTPSETFIAREIEAVEARGVAVEVFPLWPAEATDAAATPTHPVQWCGRFPIRPVFRHFLAVGWWKWRLMAQVGSEGWAALKAPWLLPAAMAMADRMRALGVERVHAQFANAPSTVGWVAASVAGLPFSLAVHARDVFVEPQFLRAKARAADHILACNSAVAARAAELADPADRGKIQLVRHSLPLERYPFRDEPPESEGPPLILGVGRLVEKKGFVHLVRAMARLRDAGAEAACWLIGEGPERGALRREIDALGLRDRVELKGWMTEGELKMVAYEQAAVLAVPSVVARDGDRDGLPNVALEAAAIGLPIVATDVGGIGDLVRDGHTGLVARPADPDHLADRLRAALTDPDGAMARALQARADVEARFHPDACTAALLAALGIPADPAAPPTA